MEQEGLKSIIEAMLFASERPLSIDIIRDVLETIEPDLIHACINELNKEYEDSHRAFKIEQIAGGFQLVTHAKFAPYLAKLFQKSQIDRMSRPTLETIAIIAYKQPVTRAEIEAIRGVNSEGVLKTLLERGLVKISGRKETVGRPFTYSTTEEFLERFGLGSLGDLPRLKDKDEIPPLEMGLRTEETSNETGGGHESFASAEEGR